MVVRNEVTTGAATRPSTAATAPAPAPAPAPAKPKHAAKPQPTPALVDAPPQPAPRPAPAKAKPPSPAKSSHATPFYVQLASRASEAAARDYWTTQRQAHGDLLGSLSPVVTAADLGAKGMMYRLKAGPLTDRAAATALCARLAKQQLDCLVVRDIPARPAP